MALESDPYSSAQRLLPGYPAWINDEQEAKRVASYQLYEDIYWTVPDTFKLIQRGSDADPIYIPSGRIIVETLHRYMANHMRLVVDPEFGDDNQKLLATQVMTDFVRRERVYSKFTSNKRYGIMRGDWAFHLYADPDRPEGSRISFFTIDPGSLFPIYNEDNLDEIVGWHIVEQFLAEDGKPYIKRLTYRKETGVGGPSSITVEDAVFEVDAWGGPMMVEEKRVRQLRPPTTLPQPIDQLPIYHIPNFDEPGNLWGSSELRGIERIMASVNQSISDEELILAMEGLGCYSTDAAPPIDEETGEDIPWNLGPGRVVEVPAGSFFNRVSGVHSVIPYQDHLKYLDNSLDLSMGMTAAAKGRTSVDVAESGVALLIELGPMLSRVEEKEQVVTDKVTNMTFDLAKWFVAYEGTAFNSLMEVTRWSPVYGDKIPVNKPKQVEQVIKMATTTPPILPLNHAWNALRKIGIELASNEELLQATLEQQAALAGAEADAVASRINGELEEVDETLSEVE